MATPRPTAATATVPHHRVRTFFAGLFGFFAVGLIITSVIVVWLNRTLTDTTEYVNTVAPLVQSQAVQNFVVDKVTDQFVDGRDVSLHDFATQLLGPAQVAGKTDDQLKAMVTPVVQQTLRQIISSPAFAKLWTDTNRSLHGSLISQLNNQSSTVVLNVYPLLNGVMQQLAGTKLAFVQEKMTIDQNGTRVSFKGKQLDTVRKGYHYFQDATWLIVLLTILCVALCVWLSVHHKKTARRIAMATGIYAAVLCVLLSAGSLVNFGGQDKEQQQLVKALFNGITHDLRLSLFIVAILGVGGALASKFYDNWRARRPAR